MVRLCVHVLLIDPLSPHEDFGFAVQREGAIVFPEAVKQLHVFEFSVLVAHWEHTSEQRLETVRAGASHIRQGNHGDTANSVIKQVLISI